MKVRVCLASLALVAAAGLSAMAQAQNPAARPATPAAAPAARPAAPSISIAPVAADAVRVVDSFSSAMTANNLASAGTFLDPGVVIVANGVAHGSRDEYLNTTGKARATFLGKAQAQLLRRQARGGPNFAWVVSSSSYRLTDAGKTNTMLTTESMLLSRSPQGWKIIHIHWSSRPIANR
jgi:ketosteroid isomerase-like protein